MHWLIYWLATHWGQLGAFGKTIVAIVGFLSLSAGLGATVMKFWRECKAKRDRLIPKFGIKEWVITETPTIDRRDYFAYVQLIVRCLTDAPVKGCRGRLLQVYKRYGHKENWNATAMNEPFDLEWSNYPNILELTLEPGIDQRLNVCRSFKSVRLLYPTLLVLPARAHAVFDSSGTFRFDIKITAKDCPSIDASVTVTIDECEWNKPIVELIQGHSKI
ncbi:MAG: hypothetical protein ABSA41_12950 [Terriglobia bacterium]|jgi:hypothetical protein